MAAIRGRWLLLVACLLLPPAASAERSSGPRTLDEILHLPERLSLELDQRTRYEYLDNQFRAGRPGEDEILALRTRLRAELGLFEWLSLGAEFQDSRAYLADANTPVGTGLVNAAELLRAYAELRFDAWKLGGLHEIQIGRITMDHGSRRLVARNRFRNTSNAFTGLDWIWRNETGRQLRAFYTLPVQRLPNERARLVNNEVEYDRDTFDFQFFGLFFRDNFRFGDALEVYLYGLVEEEAYDTSDGDVIPERRLGTPGVRLVREPVAGRFDYEWESVIQGGRSRQLAVNLDSLDHFAHFHHLTVGYTFDCAWSPRLLVHYTYASGDEDPFDGDNGHFDTLFGARRFEYGPTSIYGAFARTNMSTPGIRLQAVPGPRWSGFVDYRAVWLAQARDEWGGTGVRDLAGDSGTFVGHQIEFRVRWRPLPGNVLLEGGYAHLFAGAFIENAPNANGGDTNYVYVQWILEL